MRVKVGKMNKEMVTIDMDLDIEVVAKLRKLGKKEGLDFPACGFSLLFDKVIEPMLAKKRRKEDGV